MAVCRTINFLIAVLAIASLAVSLQGCTKSAEQKAQHVADISDELGHQFSNNYDGVKALTDKFVVSNLDHVRLSADGSVRASIYDGSTFEEIRIEDSAMWRRLLIDAGVDTAYKRVDGVTLIKQLKPLNVFGGSVYEYQFFSSAYDLSQSCLPQHFEAECGACIESLNAGWHLSVSWYPSSWVDELQKSVATDAGQSEETILDFSARADACIAQFSDMN